MTLPVWPVSLPTRPLKDGNKRGPKRGANTTEMEDGPDVLRRASRIRSRKETVNLDLTPTQMTTFEGFYETSLDGGTSRFTMPTVDADGTVTNRIVSIIPKPELPYEQVWMGSTWRVVFDMQVYS